MVSRQTQLPVLFQKLVPVTTHCDIFARQRADKANQKCYAKYEKAKRHECQHGKSFIGRISGLGRPDREKSLQGRRSLGNGMAASFERRLSAVGVATRLWQCEALLYGKRRIGPLFRGVNDRWQEVIAPVVFLRWKAYSLRRIDYGGQCNTKFSTIKYKNVPLLEFFYYRILTDTRSSP